MADGARLHQRSSSDAIADAQTGAAGRALTARRLLLGLWLKVERNVSSQG